MEELAIDRCFKHNDGEVVSTQLHHFADASQQGYGAVTYLRIKNSQGDVKCSFVMGKSRLAPIKSVTIPRMGLSAAVTATKLNKICQGELGLPVEDTLFWTDSTCVLKYLENQDKRFQTFVANRIATIQEASSPTQWRYVSTLQNPTDDASRGVGYMYMVQNFCNNQLILLGHDDQMISISQRSRDQERICNVCE